MPMPRFNWPIRISRTFIAADIVKSSNAVGRRYEIRMLIESRIEKSDSDPSASKPRIGVEPIGSRNHREPIQTMRMIVCFDVSNPTQS